VSSVCITGASGFIGRTLRVERVARGLAVRGAVRSLNSVDDDSRVEFVEVGEIGADHEPETHLIPLAIRAAQWGDTVALAIFGTDYVTPGGTAVRDYIHVTDLAEAHVLALADLLGGVPSAALNLGTGQGHSVREVISMIEAVGGRQVPAQDAPRRSGDPPVLVADPKRAMARLNWRPTHPSLSSIIETSWRWHQSR